MSHYYNSIYRTRTTTRSCRDPEMAVSPLQATVCPVGWQRRRRDYACGGEAAAVAAAVTAAAAAAVCRQGGRPPGF